MQYSQVSAHLRDRGELLLSGQTDRMVQDFVFPLPVFLQASCLVLHSPRHAQLVFSYLRQALLDRGVVALLPKVTAMDLPRAGRFRVWADWQEIASPGEGTRVSQVIYYCRQTDLGLRTEMVNYTHLSTPELDQEFAALALSA